MGRGGDCECSMLKEEEYCTVNPSRKEFPKEEGREKNGI